MQTTTRLLAQFVQGVRVLTGADSVSLFIPESQTRLARPTLIHDGNHSPIAELVDEDAARQFVTDVDPSTLVPGPEGLPLCLPSRTTGGGLIPLPAHQMPWSPLSFSEGGSRRRRDSERDSASPSPGAWLGLRLPPGQGKVVDQLQQSDLLAQLRRQDEPGYWWSWLFTLGGALASHTAQATAFLKDPMTGLADRREFQAVLTHELLQSKEHNRPISLLMINPDDFLAVNERFGREMGDLCVQDISDRLLQLLRAEDLIARYGGVIFAAILPDTPPEEAQEIAERLRQQLTQKAYLDGELQLGFSIGCIGQDLTDPNPSGALELVQQADRALSAAKRSGGNRTWAWDADSNEEDHGSLDRLSGIFTGNMDTDYRNMVLLWDTVNVIALDPDFDQLVSQVAKKLYEAFKPTRVGLFSRSIDDEFHLLHGFTRLAGNGTETTRLETLELGTDQMNLLTAAISDGAAQARRLTDSGEDLRCCAVPLIAGNDCLGCLYLDGRAATLSFDTSDLVFFRALGSQVATAMDRTRLSEIESRRQEQEKRLLRAELKELRQALQQAKLVYRSPQMESLVATAHRVASTEATVLITGASGTGKELLARTVHELSSRRGQPFVIVDCGAIPTTLIESELFGSEKGAFTGAQTRRAGRLAEANYGTVLLDEIGELPLEVQSKLLRFVQEKQVTRVGGTRQQKVDVRILAATNRNLKSEVAAGRFREDLYYRLNVIHLAVPPLRDRPEDILHLANHFLEIFAVQYQKNVRRITPAAASALTRHIWPGNVRELQNRVMQAVILCEGSQLGPEELGLASSPSKGSLVKDAAQDHSIADPDQDLIGLDDAQAGEGTPLAADRTSFMASNNTDAKADERTPRNLDTLLAELRQKLAELVYAADNGLSPSMLPLGRWLDEDLLIAADTQAEGVARRGAATLGLAETTFRRRLQKARDRIYAGLSPRVADWEDVQPILAQMVRTASNTGRDLIGQAQRVLLEEIAARFPSDVKTGAALLAVSNPTYRKRLAEIGSPDDRTNEDEPRIGGAAPESAGTFAV